MDKLTSILVIAERNNADLGLLNKAIQLARHFGAQIELFTCDGEHSADFRRAYDKAGLQKEWLECVMQSREYLETLRKAASAPDVRIWVDAMADPRVPEAIARKIAACHPDLVMKSAARAHPNRRFTLDSGDWELMRTCPSTLMLVRGRPWNAKARFAAMVDVSDPEKSSVVGSVLHAADYFALGCLGELDVVYSERDSSDAVRMNRAEALVRISREHRVRPSHIHILTGDPEETLPAFAAREGYDAIVLGAMSHRKSLAVLVDRLTGRFVEALHCDFLFVKPESVAMPKDTKGAFGSRYSNEGNSATSASSLIAL